MVRDAPRPQPIEQSRRKVQAGRRSRHRTARRRVDGLVALVESTGRFGPLDVGRQGHVADGVDGGVHIAVIRPEPDRAPARDGGARAPPAPAGGRRLRMPPAIRPSASVRGGRAHPSVRRPAAPAAGTRRRPPLGSRRPSRRAGTTRVSLTTSTSPGASSVSQIRDAMVGARPRGAVEPQQARPVAHRRRLLGDQLGRQVVVEIRKAHEPAGVRLSSPSAAARRPR